MTHEEFQQQLRDTPNLELLEMAQIALSKLCSSGGDSFTMTVPPRIDDTDMVFGEVLKRFKQFAYFREWQNITVDEREEYSKNRAK